MTAASGTLNRTRPSHANNTNTAALSAAQQAAIVDAIADCIDMPGAMLPLLHGIQHALGFIPPAAVPLIADALNVSRAEVHGVITYYTHFRQTPPGDCTLQVCRAEACQARGSDALVAHAKAVLGCDFGETTLDGSVTLQAAYCLGHCAVGPNIMIGDLLHARITPGKFDALIAAQRGAK
jgi:formate dehydrogenase subunit gamma